MNYAYIIAGAVAGAPLRYFLAGQVQRWQGGTFPTGTLVVNVTGCLLIGILAAIAEERSWLSKEARLLLITGFLGSYTTFSAFGLETYSLFRDGEGARAVLYVAASLVAGIVAVWLGFRGGQLVA